MSLRKQKENKTKQPSMERNGTRGSEMDQKTSEWEVTIR